MPSALRIVVALLAAALVLLAGFTAYGAYRYRLITRNLSTTQSELASTTASLADTVQKNTALAQSLEAEQKKNGTFESQIQKISSTVGTLDKLSKTDPELLKKYSKIYFLNENYVPVKLADIDPQYLYEPARALQFHAEALPHLLDMLSDAAADGLHLQVISAYRSFGTQAALKSSYKVTYGAGTANSFSADQGYSEHQLGTALDFTTPTVGASFAGFDKTPEYAWLMDNAYRYGFILSYPKDNTYYEYEPWHWRFVGLDLARMLHNEGKDFYDLDQREIDPYLVSLFD